MAAGHAREEVNPDPGEATRTEYARDLANGHIDVFDVLEDGVREDVVEFTVRKRQVGRAHRPQIEPVEAKGPVELALEDSVVRPVEERSPHERLRGTLRAVLANHPRKRSHGQLRRGDARVDADDVGARRVEQECRAEVLAASDLEQARPLQRDVAVLFEVAADAEEYVCEVVLREPLVSAVVPHEAPIGAEFRCEAAHPTVSIRPGKQQP